jgi:hypothetical protein
MADYHFSVAESWPELVEAHAKWVSDYNEQSHWAHREREQTAVARPRRFSRVAYRSALP